MKAWSPTALEAGGRDREERLRLWHEVLSRLACHRPDRRAGWRCIRAC